LSIAERLKRVSAIKGLHFKMREKYMISPIPTDFVYHC
jgi:hypothetical protein